MGLGITQIGATTLGPSTSTVQPRESNFTSLSIFLSWEYLPGLGSNTDLLPPPSLHLIPTNGNNTVFELGLGRGGKRMGRAETPVKPQICRLSGAKEKPGGVWEDWP